MDKRFLLIEASVLPEVFVKVLKAKELLASGAAKNVSVATKMADISRSAFYKYKDSIFDADNAQGVITINAVLQDETGALQALLAGVSAAGASIVTINQEKPENGSAAVSVTIRTEGLQMSLDEMLTKLKSQHTVIDVRRSANLV
ncbi:MAG: ACT domain-containing protein [Oscillospiraceae bacterium]|nr:ACT domain-containing protein [Oscillospiraceae bacterium]